MSRFGDLIGGVNSTPPEKPVVEPDPVVEEKILDFDKMSKSELEIYGRTVGIELDRRHSKSKLIEELEEKISE
tara:strand:+ start:587 stop:805 length:219 start_codon:yes stop_codon:yes gene_type:complete